MAVAFAGTVLAARVIATKTTGDAGAWHSPKDSHAPPKAGTKRW
jgi:hypothetical protein